VARDQLKDLLKRAGLYQPASAAWIRFEPRLTAATRAITGKNERLAGAYLKAERNPKLHIGAGANHLSGWLNTELCPRGDQIYLDATRRFPFADGVFAFIYSEHMIEHIPFAAGEFMLRECRRVLRPGGVIRIVTPNMEFLKAILQPSLSPAQLDYLRYFKAANQLGGPDESAVHVVNHFVRAWGHQFIYDLPTLTRLVAAAGFEDVESQPLQQSKYPELAGLAKTDRMPDGFVEMESIIVEGRRGR
jgi:predicted SAM-dependent methyltransferase